VAHQVFSDVALAARMADASDALLDDAVEAGNAMLEAAVELSEQGNLLVVASVSDAPAPEDAAADLDAASDSSSSSSPSSSSSTSSSPANRAYDSSSNSQPERSRHIINTVARMQTNAVNLNEQTE
jgi:hypothetical protein